jgi:hypothetical protein
MFNIQKNLKFNYTKYSSDSDKTLKPGLQPRKQEFESQSNLHEIWDENSGFQTRYYHSTYVFFPRVIIPCCIGLLSYQQL